MTQQEKQDIDKKCDEFCEYRRTHSNGYPPREWFMAGVKALDEIRKPSEPDKKLLEALKETDKDLCVLESTMLQIEQRDHLAEGMAELVKKWRARNKQAISNYEKTDQMTYSDYVRKDLALEFATRFCQLMTSARVDEYIGTRKDVCVNDLFEDFLKSKEDEKRSRKNLNEPLKPQLNIPDVIGSPILAKIEHINDLGKSKWYEVVYYDEGWYSYAGSKTFQDGEQVVEWKYCKDCL